MDPTTVSNGLLGLGGAVGIVVTTLSTAQRRARARARRQAGDLEVATTYILASRRERHVHNDRYHPDGTNAIALPELPAYLSREED